MSLINPSQRFDVHCHFFNHNILSLRLLVELLIALRKHKERKEWGECKGKISRYLHFVKIGFSSVEKIYQSLEKDENGFAFCPLMFDLESTVFSGPHHGSETSMNEMVDELKTELRAALDQGDMGLEGEEIWSLFEEHIESINLSAPHFPLQEQQLLKLKTAMPTRIFPFFAVDPRRSELFAPGEGRQSIAPIIERINPGRAFSGIKLYAPNGHSPADARLLPLYAYCEANQIPITAHCSGSGFASFVSDLPVNGPVFIDGKLDYSLKPLHFIHNKISDPLRIGERAQALNHPLLWEEVLKQFPLLKLNLAHFGLHNDGQWTKHIFTMMQKYPNLYTDFSCVTEKSALKNFYTQYYRSASPELKKRFLYGSDFYLNILFISSQKEYIDQFTHCFTSEEWDALTMSNPARFLTTNKGWQ